MKRKITSTAGVEYPYTISEGAGGTGDIFEEEQRNRTRTHIGKIPTISKKSAK